MKTIQPTQESLVAALNSFVGQSAIRKMTKTFRIEGWVNARVEIAAAGRALSYLFHGPGGSFLANSPDELQKALERVSWPQGTECPW